jgi:phosphoribosylpyrophosphate synthetase
MSNIDYSKKYLKYKNRYLNTKYDTNQLGGKCDDNNYILLSCTEFNSLVDDLFLKNMDSTSILQKDNLEYEAARKAIMPSFFTEGIDKDFKKFMEDLGMEWKEDNFSKIKKEEEKLKLEFIRSSTQITSKNFYRGYINWSSYADNTPNIKMNKETVKRLKDGKVIFFAYFSFNEPTTATSIVSQLLFLNSLNHYGVAEINIVLPYFPVGTMERIVGEGEIPTAYSLAHMLNMIPSGASKNKLYVFDIHALCSRFFFHTNTIPVLISMMPNYLNEMKATSTKNSGKSIVVFPDDGAKKRFEKLITKEYITITCSKIRVGVNRIVKITDGLEKLFNTSGEGIRSPKLSQKINLFLIDDLVQTGGTLVETFKGLVPELVDGGYPVGNINCYTVVTHSVFPDPEKTKTFFEAKVDVKGKKNHPLNITLITTCSRPLRVPQLCDEYKGRVKVLPLTDALHTIFTCKEQNPYISPFSIN